MKMEKARTRNRKSKPKSLDRIRAEKKHFSTKSPDLLLETIGVLIGNSSTENRPTPPVYTDKRTSRTSLTRKEGTQHDPKKFFQGTVFEEMFYPPTRSVIQEFLEQSSNSSRNINSRTGNRVHEACDIKAKTTNPDTSDTLNVQCITGNKNDGHKSSSMELVSEQSVSENEGTIEIETEDSTSSSSATTDGEVSEIPVSHSVAIKSTRMSARRVPIKTPYLKSVKGKPKTISTNDERSSPVTEKRARQDSPKSNIKTNSFTSPADSKGKKARVELKIPSVLNLPLIEGSYESFMERVRVNITKHLQERGILPTNESTATPRQLPSQECVVSSSTEPQASPDCILIDDSDSDNARAGFANTDNDDLVTISD